MPYGLEVILLLEILQFALIAITKKGETMKGLKIDIQDDTIEHLIITIERIIQEIKEGNTTGYGYEVEDL